MKRILALLLCSVCVNASDLVGSFAYTAAIASSGSVSQSLALHNRRPLAIQTPSALTGTAITFRCSYDESTWANLYDDTGTEISVTVSTSRYIALDPSKFAGCEFIQLRSGTNASPTAEGAAREIKLITGRVLN
jgi:hypothetical protein